MRSRKSAGLEEAAEVAGSLAVTVSVPPPDPPAALLLAGAPSMANPIANIPKHTPYVFIIMMCNSLSAGRPLFTYDSQAPTSAGSLCFANLSVQFILSLPAITNVPTETLMLSINALYESLACPGGISVVRDCHEPRSSLDSTPRPGREHWGCLGARAVQLNAVLLHRRNVPPSSGSAGPRRIAGEVAL